MQYLNHLRPTTIKLVTQEHSRAMVDQVRLIIVLLLVRFRENKSVSDPVQAFVQTLELLPIQQQTVNRKLSRQLVFDLAFANSSLLSRLCDYS